MPSIYDLKPAFQGRLRPIVGRLAQSGISPNQVTIAALVLSILGGIAIALWPGMRWPLLLVPPVLFLRMALNAIDGMLAREHAMQTRLGALLNELGDVVSDAALYLPFAWVLPLSPALVVGVVFLGALSEMAGVTGQTIGASRRYDGPMGKSDRAVLFGALGIWLAFFRGPAVMLDFVLVVICGLLLVTIFNRCRRALDETPA